MRKILVNHKRTEVIYDTDKKAYIKIIKLKFSKKLKCFFKIRKYPGYNYKYISDILNENGIKTAEILSFNRYTIITREIVGEKLLFSLMNADKNLFDELINKYVETVSKIINLGIYFGDFNFNNFIVHNKELFLIDLEDYRKDLFSSFRKKSLIKRLKRQLLERTEILGNMNKFYNGKDIYNKIEKKIDF